MLAAAPPKSLRMRKRTSTKTSRITSYNVCYTKLLRLEDAKALLKSAEASNTAIAAAVSKVEHIGKTIK